MPQPGHPRDLRFKSTKKKSHHNKKKRTVDDRETLIVVIKKKSKTFHKFKHSLSDVGYPTKVQETAIPTSTIPESTKTPAQPTSILTKQIQESHVAPDN